MKLQRTLQIQVENCLSKYPILAITGPRQSGKTTFLRNTFVNYQYINLENPDIRSFALEDPNGFLKQYDNHVIFDEIQRAPNLFSYLQSLVDENQVMGQFILSGSQNFQLMENISQSLAGRVAIFKLFPFDFQELKQAGWLKADLASQLYSGCYPAIYDRDIEPAQYFSNYLSTYVRRDIMNLQNIQDFDAFNRLIKICANHAGQMVNYNKFSKMVGVSHTTIRQWISLLKTSYILFEIPPYYKNFNKRLVKSPKLYFYDTGLLCRLLEVKPNQLNPLYSNWGAIFENLCIAEIIKQNAHHNFLNDFYFWRDSNGHEVDLLFKDANFTYLIEIKASKTIKIDMFKNLNFLSDIMYNEPNKKLLIYGGDENQKRSHYDILSWKNLDIKRM